MKMMLGVFTVALIGGCAVDNGTNAGESEGESSDALSGNSTPDDGDLAVVGISYVNATNQVSYLCTGVLVTPRVVLTAGHCTVALQSGVVFVGKGPGNFPEVVTIKAHYAHPNYTSGSATGLNDIGAVVLERPITTASPLAISQANLSAVPLPLSAKLVGYGLTDPNNPNSLGTKRVGFAQITKVNPTEFKFSKNQGPNSALACGGDSGGPAIVNVGGAEVVVGIAVRSFCGINGQGPTFYTRVDAFQGLIQDWIRSAG